MILNVPKLHFFPKFRALSSISKKPKCGPGIACIYSLRKFSDGKKTSKHEIYISNSIWAVNHTHIQVMSSFGGRHSNYNGKGNQNQNNIWEVFFSWKQKIMFICSTSMYYSKKSNLMVLLGVFVFWFHVKNKPSILNVILDLISFSVIVSRENKK